MDTPNCNGNGPGNDAAKCQMPRCGDGYVNAQFRPAGPAGPPEAYDAGMDTPNCNGNGPGNDAAKCQAPMCGDGYFNSTMEACDPNAPDRWSLTGAEAVLRLRALRASGDFDDYWQFHVAKEHERTHASRYADGAVPNPLPPTRPHLRIVK